MSEVLNLIGRKKELFGDDLRAHDDEILAKVRSARILVIGAAGSIGRALVKELFSRDPQVLHVVDLSENNLTELVRDLRSSLGHIKGDFKTYCLDYGSLEFEAFLENRPPYDYILNFSAMKHVRSERDPYTLMRMVVVNVLSAEKLLEYALARRVAKYFAVSTDKATNPVNMMGASKRIMELFMMRAARHIPVSSARFANVAFSDGSLLDAFTYRIRKRQPLSAPRDVQRYFITERESGRLCLLAAFVGGNRETLFPKQSDELYLMTFSQIAENYLQSLGYTPYICESEDEARARMHELSGTKNWPCYFFESDTTGEKEIEEFYTETERVIWDRFLDIAIIQNDDIPTDDKLNLFLSEIRTMRDSKKWDKQTLVDLFEQVLGTFLHRETHKYLDDRM